MITTIIIIIIILAAVATAFIVADVGELMRSTLALCSKCLTFNEHPRPLAMQMALEELNRPCAGELRDDRPSLPRRLSAALVALWHVVGPLRS